MSFRFPRIRIEHRRGGRTIVRNVRITDHRDVSSDTDTPHREDMATYQPALSAHAVSDVQPQQEHQQQSKYYRYKEREIAAWKDVRETIFKSAVEQCALKDQLCVICSQKQSTVRCQDCGPLYHVCKGCAIADHIFRPLHFLEEWQVNRYQPFKQNILPVLESVEHSRCGVLSRITVLDQNGQMHDVLVRFCQCKTPVETLIEFNLWPSSPTNPRLAYDFRLLRWLHSLMLECHVSVKGFSEAVRWKNDLSATQTRSLYRLLVGESFAEFQHLIHRLSKLEGICSYRLDHICPACGNDRIICIDGNFGLVHKKSAGRSFEPPKCGNIMFMDGPTVDAALTQIDDSSKLNEGECSNFQAGDKVRAKVKNAKLDVTGVFGAVCRHEVPVRFMDLRHGERLAYPYILIKDLLNDGYPKINLMYDIACVFKKFLQKTDERREISDKLDFAIPIFHCYGHQAKCQVEFSPRRKEGFGNTDGEAMERLWSYSRPFNKISKEMTPAHRLDLLSLAFLHYGKKKIKGLVQWLVVRIQDADNQIQLCEGEKKRILQDYAVSASQDMILRWQEEEKQQLIMTKRRTQYNASRERLRKEQTDKASPVEKYVADIIHHATLKTLLRSNTSEDLMETIGDIKELEARLNKFEKQNKIAERWTSSDKSFKENLKKMEENNKINLLQKMLHHARERRFLLSLIKKYPDGQAMAHRIGNQISVSTRRIRKTVFIYNAQQFGTTSPGLPKSIEEKEALDPLSSVYTPLDEPHEKESIIPANVRKELVDLHFRQIRATEEVALVIDEMQYMAANILGQHQLLLERFSSLPSPGDHYTKGVRAMLYRKIEEVENLYRDLIHSFSFRIHGFPELEYHVLCGSESTVVEESNLRTIDPRDDLLENELSRLVASDGDESDYDGL